MSHTIILAAFDLGTTTGYAFKLSTGNVISGTFDFTSKRYEGGGMRYLRFAQKLSEIYSLNSGVITEVAYEEVRKHRGTDAAHVYGGLLATLTSWCESHNIPYAGHPVGAIKKFVTGKGNADKSVVIQAVKNLGYNPIDDNEADALALLHMVLENTIYLKA